MDIPAGKPAGSSFGCEYIFSWTILGVTINLLPFVYFTKSTSTACAQCERERTQRKLLGEEVCGQTNYAKYGMLLPPVPMGLRLFVRAPKVNKNRKPYSTVLDWIQPQSLLCHYQ
jgi:hypothetical protein